MLLHVFFHLLNIIVCTEGLIRLRAWWFYLTLKYALYQYDGELFFSPFETGWTKTETIDSLMRKAGYNGVITESLRKRLRVTRYQSTLYTMQYGDYASYVKMIRGTAPLINGARLNH